MMFTVTRTLCHASWTINKTSIRLDSGQCENRLQDGLRVATDVLDNDLLAPFPLDVLPLLSKAIGNLEKLHPNSTWRMPTYVSSVVMSYWARAVFMIPLLPNTRFVDVSYGPMNEETSSTRATLKSQPGLYVILGIQPVLGISAYFIGLALYRIPIGPGFGLISILAGVDRGTLDVLNGAALSGKAKEAVAVKVNLSGAGADRIEYSMIPTANLPAGTLKYFRGNRTWLKKNVAYR
ncbi:hypothetical protein BDV96DRAFT_561991 [Lophiotrema nucula]|uniref:Uncharacterized protein n=1 Tax=Lophiotrema nucula TaxID=690887 RepID=A0A6A5ZXK3_9PLEO|nr:hypothetical protein BDV96DRAFT_561991 [Lophiotrema nucula]